MCRNITELRGLEPAATAEEITAAARQYVRKVSGITRPSDGVTVAFEAAVAEVAATTTHLLKQLPPRKQTLFFSATMPAEIRALIASCAACHNNFQKADRADRRRNAIDPRGDRLLAMAIWDIALL